jgi:hypothetical protein
LLLKTAKALGLDVEMAPEPTGHGLPLSKCEPYNRVYEQPYGFDHFCRSMIAPRLSRPTM